MFVDFSWPSLLHLKPDPPKSGDNLNSRDTQLKQKLLNLWLDLVPFTFTEEKALFLRALRSPR